MIKELILEEKKKPTFLELINKRFDWNKMLRKEKGRAEKRTRKQREKIAVRVPGDRDQAAHYCTPENHVVLVIATKITHSNTHTHTHTYQTHISSSYCKASKIQRRHV